MSHPTELRFQVRENFEQFLAGELDDQAEIPEEVVDDRPIEVIANTMLDDWAAFDAELGITSSLVPKTE